MAFPKTATSKPEKSEKQQDIQTLPWRDPYYGPGTYTGPTLNGKPHGPNGTFINPRCSFEGGFLNGKQHGFGTGFYPGGKKWREGEFVEGKRHGVWWVFKESGGLDEKAEWDHGKFVRRF